MPTQLNYDSFDQLKLEIRLDKFDGIFVSYCIYLFGFLFNKKT